MICSCSIPNPLVRDGTSQAQRPLAALDPAAAPLDGRSEAELWEYLRKFASSVNFTRGFKADGTPDDVGDWTSFFVEAGQAGERPPPAALLETFIALYRKAQAEVDGVTGRQLDWWLKKVLRLAELPARADRAFVAFELAKHAQPLSLPKGESLLAGKGDAGPRRYALDEELRVDRARVTDLLVVRREPSGLLRAGALSAPGAEAPGPAAFGSEATPLARVGFALSSQVLACAGGAERKFTATFAMSGAAAAFAGVSLDEVFAVELSGPKGAWIEAGTVAVVPGDALAISFSLGPKAPAVVAPAGAAGPVCRFTLRQEHAAYAALAGLLVQSVKLELEVTRSAGARVLTPDGPADPARPFAPLGAQPLPGSAFTVELPELEGKSVTKLGLKLHWVEPADTADLAGIYAAYGYCPQAGETIADLFQVELAALSPGAKPSGPQSLFAAELTCGGTEGAAVDGVRVRLTGPKDGFGHRLYPVLHTTAVLGARSENPPALPQPPLTPRAGRLEITYAATDDAPRLSHVHPFGESPEQPAVTLLPSYPAEGELYVGLADAKPPVRLSLLFHCDDGTADPLVRPAELEWNALGALGTFPVVEAVDGTLALTRSGVVGVDLPLAAIEEGGRLPSGKRWLRVRAPARTGATCTLRAVVPNAGVAVLTEPAVHSGHLEEGVPPKTVTKLEVPRAEIKKVDQPLPTFGGRPREPDPIFRRRAAERLRHKGRAVSVRDWEALVLEQYPDLYKVRCLNHTRVTPEADHEIAPGYVTVVLVGRPSGRPGPLRFTPLVGLDRLWEVEGFLRARCGPSVELQAANPTYQPVRATFGVKFLRGIDPAGGVERCRAAVNRLLCPWAFDASAEVPFGGVLHRSMVLAAVEHTAGVDFVTDFRIETAGGTAPGADVEAVAALTARSVLASSDDHVITVIEEAAP